MKVVHVGPPLARTGGPAGYVRELALAWGEGAGSPHELRFPPPARERSVSPEKGSRSRTFLTRLRRTLGSSPHFYRPRLEEFERPDGSFDRDMERIRDEATAWADEAQGNSDADVFFAHDPWVAARLLEKRRPSRQQVWLMLHAPLPFALYQAWSWGVPEAAWEELAGCARVCRWIAEEREICRSVDRVILPCPEASEGFARVDPGFGHVLKRSTFVLSGASARDTQGSAPELSYRAPKERVALFLGSTQPYRGFDVLLAALRLLPRRERLPGVVAVAGPHPSAVPFHSRLVTLGRVGNVGELLRRVDFLVNLNRFHLFDLSVIEALEAGLPLLLHATGGNKTFARLGAGCVVVPELEPVAVADALANMFSLAEEELTELRRRSLLCYENHLTRAHLRARHAELYDLAESTNRTTAFVSEGVTRG